MLKAVVAGAIVGCALIASNPVRADDGFYTAEQADKGHVLFNNNCAQCHRPDLTGALGPALIGDKFLTDWGGKTVEALYQYEHKNMPVTTPGSIPPDELLPITAYILKRNGLPAGATPLSEATGAKLTIPKSSPKSK